LERPEKEPRWTPIAEWEEESPGIDQEIKKLMVESFRDQIN
jgi:hypothetical protein